MINKDNIFIIRAHVAPSYSRPTFASSKISEATFGEQLKVLNVKGSWLNIMQEDGYKGWIKDFYEGKIQVLIIKNSLLALII